LEAWTLNVKSLFLSRTQALRVLDLFFKEFPIVNVLYRFRFLFNLSTRLRKKKSRNNVLSFVVIEPRAL